MTSPGRQKRRQTLTRAQRQASSGDRRDRTNLASGKMKRAGVYATAPRTPAELKRREKENEKIEPHSEAAAPLNPTSQIHSGRPSNCEASGSAAAPPDSL